MDLFKQILRFAVENAAQKISIVTGQNVSLMRGNAELPLGDFGVAQASFVTQVASQLFAPKLEHLRNGKPVQGIMDLVGVGEVKMVGVLTPVPAVHLFMPQGAEQFELFWQQLNASSSSPANVHSATPPVSDSPSVVQAPTPSLPTHDEVADIVPPPPPETIKNAGKPEDDKSGVPIVAPSSQKSGAPVPPPPLPAIPIDFTSAPPESVEAGPENGVSGEAAGSQIPDMSKPFSATQDQNIEPPTNAVPPPPPPVVSAPDGSGVFSIGQIDQNNVAAESISPSVASPAAVSDLDSPSKGAGIVDLTSPPDLFSAAPDVDASKKEQLDSNLQSRPTDFDISAVGGGAADKNGYEIGPELAEVASDTHQSSVKVEFATPKSEMATSQRSSELDAVLNEMLRRGASDLHLSCGEFISYRVDGEIFKDTANPKLTPAMMEKMLLGIMPPRNKKELAATHDTDFAYEVPECGRFRVNIFRDRNGIGSVMRHIPSKIMTASDLRLNSTILKFCELHKGLVLVTGPTGSGKSTTLAAMIDSINKSRSSHIITIEDPIEFVYEPDKCIINQREIGRHTNSFGKALRAALREDPDIVLVGEMRDLETIKIAIETAETGHLVFGTLHTNTAISTVDRIVDQFPSEQQSQIRVMLSEGLKGVISQTLLKRKGGGRVAAQEIMVVNRALAAILREGKTQMIANQMTSGRKEGNILLNEVLLNLVLNEEVDPMEAYLKSVDKVEFIAMLKAKGIDLVTVQEAS